VKNSGYLRPRQGILKTDLGKFNPGKGLLGGKSREDGRGKRKKNENTPQMYRDLKGGWRRRSKVLKGTQKA